MSIYLIIAKVVSGIVFASIDLKSTGLIPHFSNEASISSRSQSKTTAVTAFVFGVTAVLNIMFLTHSQSTPALIHGITTLQIVSIVAYYDLLTGHIPALTLICAAIFGWMPFLLNYQINLFLIGGLSNLLIAWIIYHFGVLYPQKSTQKAEKFPAFGYGDIYGLGAIGFLLGFPASFCGLILTLIFSLFGALVTSTTKKQTYLQIRVRLGVYMFLAAALILTFMLFNGY